MRILLTNDDGLHAPGLQTLANWLRREHDVFVVAPTIECSNCGHCVTVRTPLRCEQAGPGEWLVDGYPADCIRVARHHLKLEVDCVISGINPGGNLGVDIAMSGTCAGAREAAICGWEAAAISQVRKTGVTLDWVATVTRALEAWHQIRRSSVASAGFWNVNLPAVALEQPTPPLVIVRPEPAGLPVAFEQTDEGLRFRSDYHRRPRGNDTDVAVCFGGSITATFLPVV